jgi:hypothetical protein
VMRVLDDIHRQAACLQYRVLRGAALWLPASRK